MTKGLISIIIFAILLSGCEKKEATNVSKPKINKTSEITTKENTQSPKLQSKRATEFIIDYEVLKKWNRPGGGVGMEVLVSEKASKEQVLTLARKLRSKYQSQRHINIDIFDSREAWTHRDDESYPQKKYFKHYLVQIGVNRETGYNQIYWVAEGRYH